MRLLNLEIPEVEGKRWIGIEGKIISFTGSLDKIKAIQKKAEETSIDFENAIAFPGLINSHDHLEFNLFPKLGNKKYSDYVEWGKDIHKKDKSTIDEIIKIPASLRIEYGIYKNLLNGVTTVVNHGNNILKNDYPIDVFSGYNYLHSVKLEKHWRVKLNLKPDKLPFVIHIGEGTNSESYSEINKLIRWNIFNKEIIGVHGISMDAGQAKHFKALVWCPVSNDFLYGSTARIDELKKITTILFGTDSNVSAEWNLWDHLRCAWNTGLLNDTELYNAVTENAAKVWKVKNAGTISPGSAADIVVAEKKTGTVLNSFYALGPADILIIIKSGKIILFDSKLSNQLIESKNESAGFTKIKIGGRIKYVKGKLDELCEAIKSYSSRVQFPFEVLK